MDKNVQGLISNQSDIFISHIEKNGLILMTLEKHDKTLGLSKHWSPDSTPARNEAVMKMTHPVNQ